MQTKAQGLFLDAIKTINTVKNTIMNVLIVDDHPITVSGYRESLSNEVFLSTVPCFVKAYSCEEAFLKMEKTTSIELAIIDYGLPAYAKENIFSGTDLARIIKVNHPECKIIIITAHTEVLLVYDIFKSAEPDGLIIKNDLTPENLPFAVHKVLEGGSFQSPTAKKIIQEIWKKELMIDDINREILMYLSIGYKIREVEHITKLSMSAIQRRIAQMKDAFNVSEHSSLVKEANIQGFL